MELSDEFVKKVLVRYLSEPQKEFLRRCNPGTPIKKNGSQNGPSRERIISSLGGLGILEFRADANFWVLTPDGEKILKFFK